MDKPIRDVRVNDCQLVKPSQTIEAPNMICCCQIDRLLVHDLIIFG